MLFDRVHNAGNKMTYNRTAGKGGTRNSRANKHPELNFPNYNKSTAGGFTAAARTGRTKLNPAKKRRTLGSLISDALGSAMIGKSKVTGRYDSTFKDSRYKK